MAVAFLFYIATSFRSRKESFCDQFKVDLGDPNRFRTLGELMAEVSGTIWAYNHTGIHSALKMPPVIFASQAPQNSLLTLRLGV